MTDQFSGQIISSKIKLRNKSKDYVLNFKKIEEFIKREIAEIEILKNSSKSIIPEISFNELNLTNNKIIENIRKRGCLIIRDVFEDNKIENINKELEEYIDSNGYYEDQQKKAGLDKYFSDLKSGKPQILVTLDLIGLYKFPLISNFLSIIFFIFKKHALLVRFVVFINRESLVFFKGEIFLFKSFLSRFLILFSTSL